MTNHKYVVLLAGGQGSRFWPQSRTLEPKQFLSLHKNHTLFEETLNRIKTLIPGRNIFISTSELYRQQINEFAELFDIPQDNLIFEPEGKNTAPSIALSAYLISRRDPKAKIAVFPCDHFIKNKGRFLSLIHKAFGLCDEKLVIFGIPPSRPATGYGYIKAKPESRFKNKGIYDVEKFCEKPALRIAKEFLKNKSYFWNGGIFVGSAKKFLSAFKICLPALYGQIAKIVIPSDIVLIWNKIKPVSFDYGVLEKTKDILMLKAQGLTWSDLGSWQAWDELLKKDRHGNSLMRDVINLESRNITVLGNKRMIATIGLENLIIVDTPDALLITKKNKSEEVRKVVDILKKNKRQEHYLHRTVKRPWGCYTVLDNGLGFKVKLVEVKPKMALSLQKHKKRSEHWVVVEGTAKIFKGRKSYYVRSNESTFIPISCVHRLMNPTDSILRIVEVQTGPYLEEDDIVRLKDDFGRLFQRSEHEF